MSSHRPEATPNHRAAAGVALPAMLLLLSLLGVWFAPPAAAAEDCEPPYCQLGDGLAVYIGVLPAAMVEGHPGDHAEATMHDDVPGGQHWFHLVAAVFDAGSGQRIEDATVDAALAPLGLASVSRRLEPMQIAGTITYGNYFEMRSSDSYRITLTIRQGGQAEPVRLEFTYDHRTP